MAREYTVFLEGQDRKLFFDYPERELIEEAFPQPDGTPGSVFNLVQNHLVRSGSYKVQSYILWAGLKHVGKSWTLEKVKGLFGKVENQRDVVVTLYKAIYASGVLGKSIDLDADEGKDETPAQ